MIVVTDTSQFDLDISWRTVARDLRIELNPIYRTSEFDPTTDTLISGSLTVKLNLEGDHS